MSKLRVHAEQLDFDMVLAEFELELGRDGPLTPARICIQCEYRETCPDRGAERLLCPIIRRELEREES